MVSIVNPWNHHGSVVGPHYTCIYKGSDAFYDYYKSWQGSYVATYHGKHTALVECVTRKGCQNMLYGTYEDALPADMTDSAYDTWYRHSRIIDGARMGPHIIVLRNLGA